MKQRHNATTGIEIETSFVHTKCLFRNMDFTFFRFDFFHRRALFSFHLTSTAILLYFFLHKEKKTLECITRFCWIWKWLFHPFFRVFFCSFFLFIHLTPFCHFICIFLKILWMQLMASQKSMYRKTSSCRHL